MGRNPVSAVASKWVVWSLVLFVFGSQGLALESATPRPSLGSQIPLEQWLPQETQFSIQKIFKNISPSDARRGAIVAAQTRENPNYYYHWVRDAALTVEALVDRYVYNLRGGGPRTLEQDTIRQKLFEYFEFCEYIQNIQTLEGLGEPKFHVDGSAYNEPWGRPQNDGPALRALSLIHFAKILINEGHLDLVKDRFYSLKLHRGGVIKRDLEFVSHQWRAPSFDLWEEVKGDHFYTRMVQRRALLEGADFANTMGDRGAAQWYIQQAREIEQDLQNFWDPSRGHFLTTRHWAGGMDYKNSQLDTAFVLGLLHGSLPDGFLSFKDPRVLATMDRLAQSFREIYPINHRSGIPGIAIGRYPEDRYGGSHFDGGNPWVLTTLAFAEGYYRAANEYAAMGHYGRANEFRRLGDTYVARVQYHSHDDGSLNEQFDRSSGYMTSVEDLTWSYGSVLTTFFAR